MSPPGGLLKKICFALASVGGSGSEAEAALAGARSGKPYGRSEVQCRQGLKKICFALASVGGSGSGPLCGRSEASAVHAGRP